MKTMAITNKNKQPSIKIKKYHKARLQGNNKEESKRIAGYSDKTKTTAIEKTEAYKKISIKDTLLKEISLKEMTEIHAKNIRSEDERVSNTALNMAYDRVEPSNTKATSDVDKVIIIMKGDTTNDVINVNPTDVLE